MILKGYFALRNRVVLLQFSKHNRGIGDIKKEALLKYI